VLPVIKAGDSVLVVAFKRRTLYFLLDPSVYSMPVFRESPQVPNNMSVTRKSPQAPKNLPAIRETPTNPNSVALVCYINVKDQPWFVTGLESVLPVIKAGDSPLVAAFKRRTLCFLLDPWVYDMQVFRESPTRAGKFSNQSLFAGHGRT
jgi:hypothetical protein